ncbi:MAG: hypothetical protein ABI960_02740 [Candidatus Eisenbacteria bacterium]
MFVVAWRRAARAAAVVGLVSGMLVTGAIPGHADEQRVKRFGVALYAMPTSLALKDFNRSVDGLNEFTAARNLAPINRIKWAGQFGLEGRFQATHHWMLVAGFGQIKKQSRLDLLPQVGQKIIVNASILSVPENLGACYYFSPKTSGDFTMRPFVGGGLVRLVETKAKLGGGAQLADTTFESFSRPQGEGGGFYVESGIHMMFPSRYSVILNTMYRRAKASRVYEETTHQLLRNEDGSPYALDVSGFGLRLALQINLYGKPLQ